MFSLNCVYYFQLIAFYFCNKKVRNMLHVYHRIPLYLVPVSVSLRAARNLLKDY